MQLRFHPENAYPVSTDSGRVLMAAKSMALFEMDAVCEGGPALRPGSTGVQP